MKESLFENYVNLINQVSEYDLENESICESFLLDLTIYCKQERNVLNVYRVIRTIELILQGRSNTGAFKPYTGLLSFIRVELEIIEYKINHPELCSTPAELPLLKWTDSKVALVELIFSISYSLNGGRAKIKDIVSCFQYIFQVDLGNYYSILKEINLRKSDTARYINSLERNLLNVLDKMNR